MYLNSSKTTRLHNTCCKRRLATRKTSRSCFLKDRHKLSSPDGTSFYLKPLMEKEGKGTGERRNGSYSGHVCLPLTF